MTVLEGKALLEHGKAIAQRYARRVGPDVAEELRGEAVLRALRSPPPDGRMEPWLERIYRNLFVDLWRRGQLVTVDDAALANLTAAGSPEEAASARERRRAVRTSLNRLPREARRALVARYYAELDDEGAAQRFGIAPTTVRTRIHRALARLRTRLGDLRAWCPPLFGKVGAQVSILGLAPMMVATLVVLTVPAGEPTVARPVPSAVTVALQGTSARATTSRAVAPTSLTPPPRMRPQRRLASAAVVPAPAPAAVHVAMETEETVVGEILQPEGIDVLVEPGRPLSPCLVEAPADFVPRIVQMIEERL